MEIHDAVLSPSVEEIFEIDKEIRAKTNEYIKNL